MRRAIHFTAIIEGSSPESKVSLTEALYKESEIGVTVLAGEYPVLLSIPRPQVEDVTILNVESDNNETQFVFSCCKYLGETKFSYQFYKFYSWRFLKAQHFKIYYG